MEITDQKAVSTDLEIGLFLLLHFTLSFKWRRVWECWIDLSYMKYPCFLWIFNCLILSYVVLYHGSSLPKQ